MQGGARPSSGRPLCGDHLRFLGPDQGAFLRGPRRGGFPLGGPCCGPSLSTPSAVQAQASVPSADVSMLLTCSPEDLRALTRPHKTQEEPINWEKEEKNRKTKGRACMELGGAGRGHGQASGSLAHLLPGGGGGCGASSLALGPTAYQRLTLRPTDQGREPSQALPGTLV